MESVFFSDVVYIFIGVPLTFFSWLAVALWLDHAHRKKAKILNQNLFLIGKKWSFERDAIVSLDHVDKIEAFWQHMILGFILAVFSWLGFLLSLVAWFSLFFVHSRRERLVMSSDLANEANLTKQEVIDLVDSIQTP